VHFQKKTLPTGLRVITVQMPHSLATTVLVLTETGSKYETKQLSGISHFLEHMCFKGTLMRPSHGLISGELEGLGARSNAFTGHEYTGYYAKAEARHYKEILDIISDIYLNSTLPEKELEKERGVIVGEINSKEDDPQDAMGSLFAELLYGDQPAGWDILGTKNTVANMTRDDLIAYRLKHYVASSTIVIVAGKFDEKTIVDEIARAFEKTPQQQKAGKLKVQDVQEKPQLLIRHKDTHQTHLILGFRSYDIFHPLYTALMVLVGVLGEGMSSRLFLRIREEMGAGYYVGAVNQPFTDHGFLACCAGVDNNRVSDVVRSILDEITILKDKEVPESELRKVKNYLTGGLVLGLETSNAFATFYGISEVLGKPLKTPDEKAEAIRQVTAEQIREVAEAIFQNQGLNLVLIGPFEDREQFIPLLSV